MELKIALISYWIPAVATFFILTYHGELRMESRAQRTVLSLFPMVNFTIAFLVLTGYLVEAMISGWNKLDKIG